MRTEFDIENLFRDAFGFRRGQPFDAGSRDDTDIRQELDFDAGLRDDTGIRQELNFADLPENNDGEGVNFLELHETVNRRDHLGRLLFMPVRLGSEFLPNEPTMALTNRKNIIETALAGSTRRGTVKELISMEDWQITIRGIVVNTESTKVYPEDQVHRLLFLYERNEALEIECALTNLLNIRRVVIKSINFPEMVGVQHAQAYEMELVGDEDFDLEID